MDIAQQPTRTGLAGTGPPDRTGPGHGPDPDRSDIRGAKASHHGSWIMDHGLWIKDHGSLIKDHRLKIQYQGSDQGSWIVEQVSRIKDHGSRTLDLGPCSGMNDHPGRDTDVRSSPSEFTIKDLSCYIGFIKIQSSIKHLGPCLCTNGHFRRDPDVISTLPDTTIHLLSVFIGCRC